MGATVHNPADLLEPYLKPLPTPPGMTSREIVRKAIEFDGPPRVPYSFVEPLASDFFESGVLRGLAAKTNDGGQKPKPGEIFYDEWGVAQQVTGRAWNQAIQHPLQDLARLDDYRFPDVADPARFAWMAPYLEQAIAAGKYVVGYDSVLMFERMRALMGFEALMMAPYTQPMGLEALLDRLTNLIAAIIDQWASLGAHAFMTWEDFGLQTTLQMKIETFRQFYKPRYARLVEAAHKRDMHYIWHNCGQIWDMIPDLIEIGVDVLQLDQPRLMGSRRLADAFGGQICFWNAVDIQWCVSPSVTDDDLRAEVAAMVRPFERFNGGFMARQYPAPKDIDLSVERQRVIYEAFMENGCRL